MKKILSVLLVLVMVLGLVACGTSNTPSTNPSTAPSTAPSTNPSQENPKSGTSFTVVVTDLDGTATTFEYTSDAETVGAALLAEGLIEGDTTDYGLYITSVNGITADWDKDQTYWAFYINGEYATTGIDGTEIAADTTYGLTLTKG